MNWGGKSSYHTETKISSGNISGGNIPTASQGGKTVGGGEFLWKFLFDASFFAADAVSFFFFTSVSQVEAIGKQV